MKSRVVTIRLKEDLLRRVQKARKFAGRNQSEFLRKAIEEYCEETELEEILGHGKRAGRRLGLYSDEDTVKWLEKKGQL